MCITHSEPPIKGGTYGWVKRMEDGRFSAQNGDGILAGLDPKLHRAVFFKHSALVLEGTEWTPYYSQDRSGELILLPESMRSDEERWPILAQLDPSQYEVYWLREYTHHGVEDILYLNPPSCGMIGHRLVMREGELVKLPFMRHPETDNEEDELLGGGAVTELSFTASLEEGARILCSVFGSLPSDPKDYWTWLSESAAAEYCKAFDEGEHHPIAPSHLPGCHSGGVTLRTPTSGRDVTFFQHESKWLVNFWHSRVAATELIAKLRVRGIEYQFPANEWQASWTDPIPAELTERLREKLEQTGREFWAFVQSTLVRHSGTHVRKVLPQGCNWDLDPVESSYGDFTRDLYQDYEISRVTSRFELDLNSTVRQSCRLLSIIDCYRWYYGGELPAWQQKFVEHPAAIRFMPLYKAWSTLWHLGMGLPYKGDPSPKDLEDEIRQLLK